MNSSEVNEWKEKRVVEWLRKIRIDWGLDEQQLADLLRVETDRLRAFLDSQEEGWATLPVGLEATAPLIAVFRKLAARYPKSEDQVKWLFTEHQDFGGSKPIDVAASSLENLYWLGYYLDSKPA